MCRCRLAARLWIYPGTSIHSGFLERCKEIKEVEIGQKNNFSNETDESQGTYRGAHRSCGATLLVFLALFDVFCASLNPPSSKIAHQKKQF